MEKEALILRARAELARLQALYADGEEQQYLLERPALSGDCPAFAATGIAAALKRRHLRVSSGRRLPEQGQICRSVRWSLRQHRGKLSLVLPCVSPAVERPTPRLDLQRPQTQDVRRRRSSIAPLAGRHHPPLGRSSPALPGITGFMSIRKPIAIVSSVSSHGA